MSRRIDERGDALAAAALADDAERCALSDLEGDVIDRAEHTLLGAEPRDEITDAEQGWLLGGRRRSRHARHAKLSRVNWSSTTIMAGLPRLAGLVILTGVTGLGCAPRPRMCTASSECVAQSACVAGRCQPDKPNVKPAIDAARRLVVRPTGVAYLRRGDGANGGALAAALCARSRLRRPHDAFLGPASRDREHRRGLRRAPPFRRGRRRSSTDFPTRDPDHRRLGAAIHFLGAAASCHRGARSRHLVEPGGPALVRLDVRDLVRQWPKHDPRDQGVAIVADNETRTGTTFAFRAVGTHSPADVEPYLELYLR